MKNMYKKTLALCLAASVAVPAFVIADDTHTNNPSVVDRVANSDTMLTARLETTYALNPHLSAFEIDVDVRNQVAHLGGTVGSDIEKDLAGEIAKSISGIRDIDNDINVDANRKAQARSGQTHDRSFGQTVEDLTTTASIKTKFLTDTNVGGLKVNVDTMNDRVILRGTVRSSAEKALAEQIAKNTSGVQAVDNQLVVNAEG